MLISGFLASRYLIRDAGLLERLATSFFFGITLAPFLNINYALITRGYISYGLIFLSCIVVLICLILLPKETFRYKESVKGFSVLFFTVLIAVFSFYYYSNKEFILSLGSYLIKGEAKCFYMQSFETVKELHLEQDRSFALNKAYEIICTPGNILFTSTLLPVFKLYSYKIVYLLFSCLLFVFIYLIIMKLLDDKVVALSTAIFGLLNPYMLSVETLDRNVMALSMSAVFIYIVLQHRDKVFLHGFLFGILAGTGLRFLPLLFILLAAIIYYPKQHTFKNYLLFISAFIITFAFNLPHLYFHGFRSLGETSSSLSLAYEAFTKWQRTPFLPFPNLFFYLLNILNYFGYLFSCLILLGAVNLYRVNKRFFYAFSLTFLSILFILSYQRNWLESDKQRIIICGFLPLYIFFAYGLKVILTKSCSFKKYFAIFVSLTTLVLFVRLISAVNFSPDKAFYERRFIYQAESPEYYNLSKRFLLNINLFPNYHRLFMKTNLRDKAQEEQIVLERLFPKDNPPNYSKFKEFYSKWTGLLSAERKKYPAKGPVGYSYLKIDFERLARNPDTCVTKIKYSDLCSIDLSEKDNLFDVYYGSLNVGWQKERLGVCVILRKDELGLLKRMYIDLNAFMSEGKNEDGFEVIYPFSKERKPASGMNTFPLFSEDNTMIFKVPDDLSIVVRNWFINENGSPYKVDSWLIKADKNGNYKSDFFYNEPESYL